MRYAIVIKGIEGEFSAYVPDLPGCVAAGDTLAEVIELMDQAVRMHIEGLQEDGLPVPIPSTVVDYVTT